MQVIRTMRTQEVNFVVPDSLAARFNRGNLSYDGLMEELDKIGGRHDMVPMDFAVEEYTTVGDIVDVISTKDHLKRVNPYPGKIIGALREEK